MTYFRWPNKTAIGSSYCLDQSPGAERSGGLTVTIRWRIGDKGTIASKATDFHERGALDESLVHALARVAEEGVREAARGLNVDLDDFDITLSDFAFHPVDSWEELYRHAAGSAFRSAWEAWERWYAAIAERRNR